MNRHILKKQPIYEFLKDHNLGMAPPILDRISQELLKRTVRPSTNQYPIHNQTSVEDNRFAKILIPLVKWKIRSRYFLYVV